MKNKLLVVLKNIFMYTTLIWSSVMLISYLSIIFELPVFLLISYIPLVGDFIIEVLEFLVLFGIWGIPILYIIPHFFENVKTGGRGLRKNRIFPAFFPPSEIFSKNVTFPLYFRGILWYNRVIGSNRNPKEDASCKRSIPFPSPSSARSFLWRRSTFPSTLRRS